MGTAAIALGGNLGDVAAAFAGAHTAIDELQGCRVTASSLLYRTLPLGPPGQPDYLNAAITVETTRSPVDLLAELHAIEAHFGRRRLERWGPRTLDLDLLCMDDTVLAQPEITLPHPQIAERMFVLRPLCDVAPNWQHPLLKRSAGELLAQLLARGEKPLPEGTPW